MWCKRQRKIIFLRVGLALSGFVAFLGGTTAQQLIEVRRARSCGRYEVRHACGSQSTPTPRSNTHIYNTRCYTAAVVYINNARHAPCGSYDRTYQVATWRDDDDYFFDFNVDLATDKCGPGAGSAINCSLRAAFWHASSLTGEDVEISLNAGEDIILTQGQLIPITG